MESHSLFPKHWNGRSARIAASPAVHTTAFIALCVVYFQGALSKMLDINTALVSMDKLSVQTAVFVALLVIVFELMAAAMIISGHLRWAGALALAGCTVVITLIGLRFWNMGLGIGYNHADDVLYHSLGLVGALVFVAAYDLARKQDR